MRGSWCGGLRTKSSPSCHPPEDRVCSGVIDSTLKHTTGQKHPLAKTYRLNAYGPYVFGLHVVGLMLQWGHDRIPVDVEPVCRKDDPK
jgi:hypothetical protein